MSDSDAAGEPVHSGGESVAAGWPHQRRMVRAGLLEKDREQEPFPRLRSPGTSSVVPRIGCVWIVRLHLTRILLCLMEKIMSKTNDVSTLDHRPLVDSELDA